MKERKKKKRGQGILNFCAFQGAVPLLSCAENPTGVYYHFVQIPCRFQSSVCCLTDEQIYLYPFGPLHLILVSLRALDMHWCSPPPTYLQRMSWSCRSLLYHDGKARDFLQTAGRNTLIHIFYIETAESDTCFCIHLTRMSMLLFSFGLYIWLSVVGICVGICVLTLEYLVPRGLGHTNCSHCEQQPWNPVLLGGTWHFLSASGKHLQVFTFFFFFLLCHSNLSGLVLLWKKGEKNHVGSELLQCY